MTPSMLASAPDELLEEALELARGGRAAEIRRDLSGALGCYQRASALLADVDPMPLHANLLRWRGSVLRDLGEVDHADRLYAESFEVAEATGATAAKAAALNCRAVISQRRGHLDEASALYRRAARFAVEAGEIRLAGMIEQNLGVLANIRGDLDGALVRYRAALRWFQEVSDDEATSWVFNNMGMLLTDLGLPLRAEKSFQQGLEIALARRDVPLEGVLRANYAEALIALMRWDEAAAAIGTALAIARAGEDRAREGEALKMLGLLRREGGELESALEDFEAALAIGLEVGDRLLAAEARRELGEVHFRQGRWARAQECWEDARRGFLELQATLDVELVTVRIEKLLDKIRRAEWGTAMEGHA